jgi:glycosyltransferase involved in cell wall biosynthesis
MIVRDEAENLPRCLASVTGVVDEMVVVDTGSTDDTVRIAEAHGAKVKCTRWPGDFALARNESLELATGDWLLVMDADEELDRRDREGLLKLVASATERGGPEGFLLRVVNHLHPRDEVPPEIHASVRLFRNRPAHRYCGPIHEQPQVPRPARTAVRIHHWGYLPEVYATRQKAARNERLLREALSRRPDDPYLLYSLAVLYYATGRAEEARLTMDKVIGRIEPVRNYHHRAVKLLAMAEEKCGRVDRALEVLDWGLSLHPDYTDLLFLRARLRKEKGDIAGAIGDVCRCLRQGDAPLTYDGHVGLGGRLALDLLADLLRSYSGCRREVFGTLAQVVDRAAEGGDHELAERAYSLVLAEVRSGPGRLEGRTRSLASRLVADYVRMLRSRAVHELRQGLEAAPWCETLALIGRSVLRSPVEPGSSAGLPAATGSRESGETVPPERPPGQPAPASGLPSDEPARESGDAVRRDRKEASPTVSLCMIVRDEEATISRCLASVAGAVDETIVVDTGSRDATREVAAAFGARVIDFPWNGDFSQARNAGLEKATSDWILVLDADEELAPGHAQMLKPLVASDPDIEGYFVRVVDFLGERPGLDQAANISFRLFRNRPEHRYRRVVHEQVTPVVLERNGRPTTKVSSLVIRHYGYLAPVDRAKKRAERNMALVKRDVGERDDPFSHFNLGSEHLKAGRLSEALQHYREAIERAGPNLVFAAEARVRAAVTLALIGVPDEALAELAEAEKDYPRYTDVHFLKGELFRETGRLVEAKKAFERCLELGEAPLEYPTLLGVGSYRAATHLGDVLLEMGSPRAALAAYARALAAEPRYVPAYLGRAKALLHLYGEEARDRFAAELSPAGEPSPAVSLLVGYAWLRALKPAWALPHLLKARADVQRLPEDQVGTAVAKAEALTGLAYLALGRDEEAVAHLRKAGPETPVSALVLALLALSRGEEARVVATGGAAGVRLSLLLAVIGEFERRMNSRAGTRGPAPELAEVYSEMPRTYEETAVEIVSLAAARGHKGLLEACLALMEPVESLAPWVRLGKYYYQLGLTTMATLELGDCLDRGVVDPEAATILGSCFLAKGQTHEAERCFRQALGWNRSSWRAWLGLWDCLRKRAATVAAEAADLLPEDETLAELAGEVAAESPEVPTA